MKKIFNKIILFTLLSVLLMPLFVYGIEFDNPIEKSDLKEVIEGIVDWTYKIALVVAPIMIMLGGFYLITAAGNPDRIQTGKKIITWTIVGIAVVLLATSFKVVIESILGGNTTTTP